MLTLTRKVGQAIIIDLDGELIRIELKETRSNVCRIGIDAPRSIPIYREEIHKAKLADNSAPVGVETTFTTSWGEKVRRWACHCNDEHTGARSYGWVQTKCADCGARRP